MSWLAILTITNALDLEALTDLDTKVFHKKIFLPYHFAIESLQGPYNSTRPFLRLNNTYKTIHQVDCVSTGRREAGSTILPARPTDSEQGKKLQINH